MKKKNEHWQIETIHLKKSETNVWKLKIWRLWCHPPCRTWLTRLLAPSSSSCLLSCWLSSTTALGLRLLPWWVFWCHPPSINSQRLKSYRDNNDFWDSNTTRVSAQFYNILRPFPTCLQVFGFLVTCVYGVNTFLAIRRWCLGLGTSCQGATHSSEYIRARTASRGEMEARPELVWVPATNQTDWGKVARRAATDLWPLHPGCALCLSGHQIFMCNTADEPRDVLCPGLTTSSPKQWPWVATKTFPFHFLVWRKIWRFYFVFFF